MTEVADPVVRRSFDLGILGAVQDMRLVTGRLIAQILDVAALLVGRLATRMKAEIRSQGFGVDIGHL